MPPAALAIPATVVPCGGLVLFAARLPCLWFDFLPPSPLPPFPVGRGRFFVFLCKGLRPLHPRHLTAYGTCRTYQTGAQRGKETHGSTQNRQEAAPYEQCRQPRRGGTGGEELRRLRWSSPPGQGQQVPRGGKPPCPPQGTTAARQATTPLPPAGNADGRSSQCRRGSARGAPGTPGIPPHPPLFSPRRLTKRRHTCIM